MLLYGAGGHARVIASCLRANDQSVTALFDDNPVAPVSFAAPIITGYQPDIYPDQCLIISVGDNFTRKALSQSVRHQFGKIAHPTALIDRETWFEEGTVLLHRCIVQAGARIGKHVIINTGAIVEHEVVVGDYVHIAPGAILCGQVKVGAGTLVGAGCIVTPNVTIGNDCLIAAGSVVTVPIPDGAVVRGNPARILTINKHGHF